MTFQKTKVGFGQTKTISPLTLDYLDSKEQLRPFYAYIRDTSGFTKAIVDRKSFPVNRKELCEVLLQQNKNAAQPSLDNIRLLLEENTFTVTTGHQLNLFTGPLYFIYKILSAIRLAQFLKSQFPVQNFVPVYWMASEDHDIAEINHTYIYGKKVEWKTNGQGAAGRLKCHDIEAVIAEVKNILGDGDHASKIVEVLRKSYVSGNTLSDSTRYLVNELFGKYGLVILEPDDSRLKKLFAPLMETELLSQTAVQKTGETISGLAKLNYEAQVHPRDINLFYLKDNARERIVKEDETWKVLNSSIAWDKETLLKELKEHPERFSPNVVLRPCYQEMILPNIAYVGGPSEIAYWLEYKSLFDYFKLFFPVLSLRNCALIIDEATDGRLDKLEISPGDIFKHSDELTREFVKRQPDGFSGSGEMALINQAYDSLAAKSGSIDPTLKPFVESERQRQLKMIQSLEEKVTRSEKRKHDTGVQQILKVKEKIFPGGTMQERHENFLSFYAASGETFFNDLLESFDPVPDQFMVLSAKKR